MDLENNLEYLLETKNQIKQALIDKGCTIEDTATFRSYVDLIAGLNVTLPEPEITYASLTFDNIYTQQAPASVTSLTLNVLNVDTQESNSYTVEAAAQTKQLLDSNSEDIYNGTSIVFQDIFTIGNTYTITCTAFTISDSWGNDYFVLNDSVIPTKYEPDTGDVIFNGNDLTSYTETITVEADVVRYIGGSIEPV